MVLKGLAALLLLGFVLTGLLAAWYLRWDEIDPPALPGEMVYGLSLIHI